MILGDIVAASQLFLDTW